MTIGVYAEQPHRIVPGRPRRPDYWPYKEHPEVEFDTGRTFPCGHTDGGFLAGNGDACRAADVLIEDSVSPPLYVHSYPRHPMSVESTHFETRVVSELEDGLRALYHVLKHPDGLR